VQGLLPSGRIDQTSARLKALEHTASTKFAWLKRSVQLGHVLAGSPARLEVGMIRLEVVADGSQSRVTIVHSLPPRRVGRRHPTHGFDRGLVALPCAQPDIIAQATIDNDRLASRSSERCPYLLYRTRHPGPAPDWPRRRTSVREPVGRRGFGRDTCRVTVASDPGVDGLQSFESKSNDRVHTCGFARGIIAEECTDRDCKRDSKQHCTGIDHHRPSRNRGNYQ
jgi:hypothetical protein